MTGGWSPSPRAVTAVPRLQPGALGSAARGTGARRSRLRKPRGGGQTLRPRRGQRRSSGSRNRPRGSPAGPPGPSGRSRALRPLPLPHPFSRTALRIRTLQSPPLLGLGPCKLQGQRVRARKSKRSIRERITYTQSPRNPEEKDLPALLKPAADPALSRRTEEAERLPWCQVL